MADTIRSSLSRLYHKFRSAAPTATECVQQTVKETLPQEEHIAPNHRPPKDPVSRGWGEKYEWHPLPEAFTVAHDSQKPVVVIVHTPDCDSCVHQRRWFAKSKNVEKLSKDLVLVNLDHHEVPQDHHFSPDGDYVPRTLFFSPDGHFMPEIHVENYPSYRHSYRTEDELVHSMRTVVKKFKVSKNSCEKN